MKIFLRNIVALPLLAIPFYFSSCLPDETGDITNPVIAVFNPTNDQVFTAGEDFSFTADFSDNEALLNGFALILPDSTNWTLYGDIEGDPKLYHWNGLVTFDLSGFVFRRIDFQPGEVVIGDTSLAGNYQLLIEAADVAGNFTTLEEGDSRLVKFIVRNESMPVISVNGLVDGKLGIQAEEVFRPQGLVQDTIPESGELQGLTNLEIKLSSCNCPDAEDLIDFEILYNAAEWDEIVGENGSIDLAEVFTRLNFVLTEIKAVELLDANRGNLFLRITAGDLQGNQAVRTIEVAITT